MGNEGGRKTKVQKWLHCSERRTVSSSRNYVYLYKGITQVRLITEKFPNFRGARANVKGKGDMDIVWNGERRCEANNEVLGGGL